jgi:curved DNA-binding protein
MDLHQAFTELGLTPHATPAQAKTAYRTLAMRWHPDVNTSPDADARMKAINVAYETVTAHLKLCAQVAASPKPRPAASRPDRAGVSATSGFSEFDWKTGFTSATGTGSRHQKAVQRSVNVSLFEAAFGCVKRIKGSEADAWTLYVRIHAGTCDGAEVAPGDISIYAPVHALPRVFKLSVQIDKHPIFTLDNDRLSVSVPMSIWRWALGGEIAVPTLDGSTRVCLPPRAGVVMVKNQGWPRFKQPQLRHPLFVMPKRVYPQSLSEDDQRLLQALDTGTRLPEVDGWKESLRTWQASYAAQNQL